MKIFVVYDSKVQSYGVPFFNRHAGDAIRGFTQAANTPKDSPQANNICMYPEDYSLFEVGIYDEEHCKFDIYLAPVCLGKAVEFLVLQKRSEQRDLLGDHYLQKVQ